MSEGNGNPFHKGDRVRLNRAGAAHFPRFGRRPGYVVSEPKQAHSAAVRFPGYSATYVATDFLERVESEQASHTQDATAALPPQGAE
jgi:hypothetical protein